MSNHLTPFDIIMPAKGLLPIEKDDDGKWRPANPNDLAVSQVAQQVFNRIFSTISKEMDVDEFFSLLDSNRHKLRNQLITEDEYIVFMGAGGDLVCAAFIPPESILFDRNKIIVDQTLYWATVNTEEEAIYLVGLLNSEAVNEVIKEFQPRGQFGARHVHKLPLGVTPKFDSNEAAHVDVVQKTRELLIEWATVKRTDLEIAILLNPNKSLASRRRQLRDKIKNLRSYQEYALACRNLYGV